MAKHDFNLFHKLGGKCELLVFLEICFDRALWQKKWKSNSEARFPKRRASRCALFVMHFQSLKSRFCRLCTMNDQSRACVGRLNL